METALLSVKKGVKRIPLKEIKEMTIDQLLAEAGIDPTGKVVALEGEVLLPDELSIQKVRAEQTVTVIEPIAGG